MHSRTGRISVAVVATVLISSCGKPAAPIRPAEAGTKRVTFAVKDMGERLALQ